MNFFCNHGTFFLRHTENCQPQLNSHDLFLKINFKLSCKSYEVMNLAKSLSHAYARVYVWYIWVQFIMISLQNSRWYFWYWYLKLSFRNNDTFLVNFVVGGVPSKNCIPLRKLQRLVLSLLRVLLYCLSLLNYSEGEFIVNWQFFMGQVSP